jgi:hypothetical protein
MKYLVTLLVVFILSPILKEIPMFKTMLFFMIFSICLIACSDNMGSTVDLSGEVHDGGSASD